jgi:hypothetical protein
MTIAELLEWAKSLGAAGTPIFALLWWLERGERKDAHDELKTITRDAIIAITEAKSSVGQLIAVFKPGHGQ